jgi:hypothetical protein
MIPIFVLALSKKGEIKQKIQSNIFNNIYYTVSTNAGNLLTAILLVLSIIISIPLSYSQISRFSYNNFNADDYSKTALYIKQNENYNDERDSKLRVDKASIDSYFVQDNLDLFISFYNDDYEDFNMVKKNPELFVKLKNSTNVNLEEIYSIYNIYIDSIPINDIRWIKTRHKQTNQKGSLTVIDVNELSPGIHKLKIDKILWSTNKDQFLLIEPWDDIVFYKNR